MKIFKNITWWTYSGVRGRRQGVRRERQDAERKGKGYTMIEYKNLSDDDDDDDDDDDKGKGW